MAARVWVNGEHREDPCFAVDKPTRKDSVRSSEKACDGPIMPISIHSLMHCSSEVANHATRSNMESCA